MARFPFMSLEDVLAVEPVAKEERVSEVARSRRGFVRAYARAKGKESRMGKEKSTGQWWEDRRDNFIARHRAQVKSRKEPLWRDGEPTRRHLALIMWAYTPTPARTERWIDSLL